MKLSKKKIEEEKTTAKATPQPQEKEKNELEMNFLKEYFEQLKKSRNQINELIENFSNNQKSKIK